MAFVKPRTRRASRFAIAAALMGVGALGVTAIDAPAYAQKSPKYSEGFIEVFAPINEAMNEDAPDYESLRDQALAARGSIENDDDRFAYGSTLYSLGQELSDRALQRDGMETMLESGKIPEDALPQYTYIAGQLAYNLEDYAAARQRIQEALALGYDAPDAQNIITRTYSLEGNTAGALGAVAEQVNTAVSAGQVPDEALLKRGLTIAYNDDLYEDATNFSMLLARYYPSTDAWGDAVAIQRNYGDYSDEELLDLLRLLRAADAMRNERDYVDYINYANFRRLPAEVAAVAQDGISAGMLQGNDAFVTEAVNESESLVDGLRSDLGDLESDAMASGAGASLAVAAGDAYLNFDNGAKAAELYELALTRPDVDRNTALTRLGIAQVKAGNYAAAQDTFAKVDGNRAPIAKLWAAYAENQASGGAGTMGAAG
ncbi:hypothetical protein [Alteriqipengyuania lutimaris]|uniref:Tetratricopeptide repeat protein n=1 Tax=Alteriqipengyuania lutimaris TaxID=1538146 RepID=A0A395LUC3_9SPHN|nr:hypothetical protein [Alteriqipengyuania lutimaris]MBB3032846.1 lipoprotein NlpI [Alteriqipengyuania lutimaris]RDS78060.1 hypothetical protein DL238_10920 [Alteriqipengyuania lutimaris]